VPRQQSVGRVRIRQQLDALLGSRVAGEEPLGGGVEPVRFQSAVGPDRLGRLAPPGGHEQGVHVAGEATLLVDTSAIAAPPTTNNCA